MCAVTVQKWCGHGCCEILVAALSCSRVRRVRAWNLQLCVLSEKLA